MTDTTTEASRRRGGIPRGLSATGPVVFSYGFRPFFLGAAVWACAAMALWIMALAGHLELGGDYDALAWHEHEMLFGFASAVLAGFLLTAVPNWTGRLPVSCPPLMLLFARWAAGRVAMLAAAFVQLAIGALAIPMGWASPGSQGLYEVLLGSTLFIGLWLVAAGLFRWAVASEAAA